MSSGLSRRRLLGGLTALPFAAHLGKKIPVQVIVDFGVEIGKTDPSRLGFNVTTFGRTALESPALAQAEGRLDARYVRIPIGFRAGHVTTGASGGPTTLDAPALIRYYQRRGVRVLAVMAGKSSDIDIQPGEVETILKAMARAGVDLDALEISSANEPNNQKLTLDQSIALAMGVSDEVRRVRPGKKIWGPAWTWYDREALRRYAKAMGDRVAGVDFHHYAMGVNSLPTSESMAQTPKWAQETSEVLKDLQDLGLPPNVSVSELNFSWRYEDGTPPDGKNHRFFTAVNTVWTASVVGHILSAGSSAAIYGNQNGPPGILSEDASTSTAPAYWGLAAWTGAKLFPHFTGPGFGQPDALVFHPGFAVGNEKNRHNVILLNKSEDQDVAARLDLLHWSGANREVWQSAAQSPTSPLEKKPFLDLKNLPLPPMSATVVVLSS